MHFLLTCNIFDGHLASQFCNNLCNMIINTRDRWRDDADYRMKINILIAVAIEGALTSQSNVIKALDAATFGAATNGSNVANTTAPPHTNEKANPSRMFEASPVTQIAVPVVVVILAIGMGVVTCCNANWAIVFALNFDKEKDVSNLVFGNKFTVCAFLMFSLGGLGFARLADRPERFYVMHDVFMTLAVNMAGDHFAFDMTFSIFMWSLCLFVTIMNELTEVEAQPAPELTEPEPAAEEAQVQMALPELHTCFNFQEG